MSLEKERNISYKTPAIFTGCIEISEMLKKMHELLRAMPICTLSKSLATTQIAYEKKINSVVAKDKIAQTLKLIRENPSLLDALNISPKLAPLIELPEPGFENTEPEISEPTEIAEPKKPHKKGGKK